MRTKLSVGLTTKAQAAIIGLWLANLIIVGYIWATGSHEVTGEIANIFNKLGMLFGLLAAFFALTQFLLMGRLPWLERPFGLDRLARYHRRNGNYAFLFIIIHPIFIAASYALAANTTIIRQYVDFFLNYPYVWLAFISQALFILVVLTSIYLVRRRLKFESWYYVHLLVYAAIVTAFFHQVAVGGSFAGRPFAQAYWFALYGFVGLSLLYWRFSLPALNLWRYNFTIKRVVRETPTTVSIYISGRNLTKWKAEPGQFVFVRMLARGFWRQEHPFSLSSLVSDNQLRLTVREVGDYTAKMKELAPGTKVVLSGPFGRFGSQTAARRAKRLYIAGGVGVTPIRGLVEADTESGRDSILMYANRSPDDVVFKSELARLQAKGLRLVTVYSDPPVHLKNGISGYISADLIAEKVTDYKERDVFICGPPPMMDAVIGGLKTKGMPDTQLHFERFSLHA